MIAWEGIRTFPKRAALYRADTKSVYASQRLRFSRSFVYTFCKQSIDTFLAVQVLDVLYSTPCNGTLIEKLLVTKWPPIPRLLLNPYWREPDVHHFFSLFSFLKEEHHPVCVCVYVCLCVCPRAPLFLLITLFQLLNKFIDFHETWPERDAIGGHPCAVLPNLLNQQQYCGLAAP